MSGIYCPLTNGTANYKTCANCVEMLCEDQKISDKKNKDAEKEEKTRTIGMMTMKMDKHLKENEYYGEGLQVHWLTR